VIAMRAQGQADGAIEQGETRFEGLMWGSTSERDNQLSVGIHVLVASHHASSSSLGSHATTETLQDGLRYVSQSGIWGSLVVAMEGLAWIQFQRSRWER
jgi:hypothetical protein